MRDYELTTEGVVAFSGAVTKTVLGVQSHSAHGLILRKVKGSLDGITASAVPGVLELCYATFATNAPATNSTSVTINQTNGRVIAPVSTFRGAKNWTAEPTALTVLGRIHVPQFMGQYPYDFPLADEYDCAPSEGFVLRFTSTATVNISADMTVGRI